MRRLAAVAVVGLAACGSPQQFQSDWERDNERRLQSEDSVQMPPAPRAEDLIEFPVNERASFKYYVDARSINLGRDKVMRYTLVARSDAGAQNVTYEGLRCPDQFRIYGTGRPDGGWGGRGTEWRPIPGAYNSPQKSLARDFFCPFRDPVPTVAEAINALRYGIHPDREVKRSAGSDSE